MKQEVNLGAKLLIKPKKLIRKINSENGSASYVVGNESGFLQLQMLATQL